jgi:hypothetical protein
MDLGLQAGDFIASADALGGKFGGGFVTPQTELVVFLEKFNETALEFLFLSHRPFEMLADFIQGSACLPPFGIRSF